MIQIKDTAPLRENRTAGRQCDSENSCLALKRTSALVLGFMSISALC
jgi:hypothetical protein